jgi:hypothetical protein
MEEIKLSKEINAYEFWTLVMNGVLTYKEASNLNGENISHIYKSFKQFLDNRENACYPEDESETFIPIRIK